MNIEKIGIYYPRKKNIKISFNGLDQDNALAFNNLEESDNIIDDNSNDSGNMTPRERQGKLIGTKNSLFSSAFGLAIAFVPGSYSINSMISNKINNNIVKSIAKDAYSLKEDQVKEVENLIKPFNNWFSAIGEIILSNIKESYKVYVHAFTNAISNLITGFNKTDEAIKACKKISKKYGQ